MDVNVNRMLPVASRLGDESVTSGGREGLRTMPQPPMPKLAARRARQTWSGRPALRSGMRPGGGKVRQCTPGKYPVASRRCQFALSAWHFSRATANYRIPLWPRPRSPQGTDTGAIVLAQHGFFPAPGGDVPAGQRRYRRRLVCRGLTPPASSAPGRPNCFHRRHDRRRRRCRWPSGNPWHAGRGRRSGVPPD